MFQPWMGFFASKDLENTCPDYPDLLMCLKLLHHCRTCHILAIYESTDSLFWVSTNCANPSAIDSLGWSPKQVLCMGSKYIGTSQATKAEPMGYGFWSNSQLGMW